MTPADILAELDIQDRLETAAENTEQMRTSLASATRKIEQLYNVQAARNYQ